MQRRQRYEEAKERKGKERKGRSEGKKEEKAKEKVLFVLLLEGLKEFFDFAGSTHEKNKWARSLEDDFAEEKEKEKKGKERRKKDFKS